MPRALFFLMVLFLPALAHAQSGWQSFENASSGEKGASVCPIDDVETGNWACFLVSCEVGGALGFGLSIAGGEVPEAMDLQVIVDGSLAGTVSLAATGEATGVFDLRGQMEPYHDALLARLRAGSAAVLRFRRSAGEVAIPVSLGGSSASIGRALELCALPDFEARAEAERTSGDPVDAALSGIEAECARMGGSVEVGPGFVRRVDLDGDGRADMVLDFGAAPCSAAPTLFCGSAGCVMQVWQAGADELFRRVFSANAYGIEPAGAGVAQLALHGSFCGRMGAEGCRKRLVFGDGAAEVTD